MTASRQQVVEILAAARKRADQAGVTYVRGERLSPDEMEALAADVLQLLRGREGRSSPIAGWTTVTATNAAVLPYWAGVAGWTEQEKKCFRPLRMAVYDYLDEQGLISKPPGHGTSIQVSPESYSGESVGTWVGWLVERIRDETSLVSEDYGAVADAGDSLAALATLVGAPTSSATTVGLAKLGRLDLTIERSVLDRGGVGLDKAVIETAGARLRFWSDE